MHPGRRHPTAAPASSAAAAALSAGPRPRAPGSLVSRRAPASAALARARLTVSGSQAFKPSGWVSQRRQRSGGTSGGNGEHGDDVVAEAEQLVRSPPRDDDHHPVVADESAGHVLTHGIDHSAAVTATAELPALAAWSAPLPANVEPGSPADPMLVEPDAWAAPADRFGAPGNVAGVDAVRKLF